MAAIEFARCDANSDLASRLLRRYYDELDARFPDGFEVERTCTDPREFVSPRGAFLIAHLDGVPVGCGAVRKLDRDAAEIKRMWIDPDVRGHGVGKQLLAALETAAAELGCAVVRLDTSAHLTEALALYRSSGYQDIRAYNDNPYAAHWLEKRRA